MLSLKATVPRTEPFNITSHFNTESLITVLQIEPSTQFCMFPRLLSQIMSPFTSEAIKMWETLLNKSINQPGDKTSTASATATMPSALR